MGELALGIDYEKEYHLDFEVSPGKVNLLADGVIGTEMGEHELVVRYIELLSKPSVHSSILGRYLDFYPAEVIEDAVNDSVAGLLERYRSEAIVREYLKLTSYPKDVAEMYHARLWREKRIKELMEKILSMGRDFLKVFESEESLTTYAMVAFSYNVIKYNKKEANINMVEFTQIDAFVEINTRSINSIYENVELCYSVEDFITRKFKKRKDFHLIKSATVDIIRGESIFAISRKYQIDSRTLSVIRDFIKKSLSED